MKIKTIDDDTLVLNGKIESSDLIEIKKVTSKLKNPKRLVVRSFGGDVDTARNLALFLRKIGIKTIIVHHVCLSSCATYLFPAFKNKVIRNGVVAFHGSGSEAAKAFLLQSSKIKNKSKIAAENMVKLDTAFFEKIGVDEKLFALSQKQDKGKGNNKVYHFLIPSIEVMHRYGIKDISGQQNTYILKELGISYVFQK